MSRTLSLLTVKVGSDMHEVLDGLDAVSARADQIGRNMSRVGRRLTAGITLPLAAVGAASVKMASDAEEAANKFDVVMGASASSARAELQQLMETIPATSAEMEGMAAGLQDLLVPMGVAREEAAGMSVGMVQLAGDIASFNNVLPTEALDAMRSALAGESEPMRRFGVDTRVARLEAIALEEGLIGLGDELTETSRAQAVMLAIQRDSSDAMGDAARTVDSTANQMKFLARDVKQLAIQIGAALIPVVTPMIALAGDLVGWLTQLDPIVLQVGIGIGALAAAIGPVLVVLGSVLSLMPAITAGLGVLAGASGPIMLGAVAFGALVAAGVALIQNWGIIKYEVQNLVETIQEWLGDRLESVVGRVNGIVDGVAGAFEWLTDVVVGNSFVPDMVDGVENEFKRMGGVVDIGLDAIANFAMGSENALSAFVKSAISQLRRLIAKMLVVKGIMAFLPGVGSFLGLGGKFAGFFAGGGHIPAGQLGMVGEAGRPEIVSSPTMVRGPANVTPMGEGGDNVFHVSFVTPDGRQVADTLTYRQKRGENLNRVVQLPVQVATG